TRFNEQFHYLFNSYYYSVGQMHPRPERGLLSRPTLKEIIDYRAHVDGAVQKLLGARSHEAEIEQLISLGLNHEQQHQELLLTDIKHVFSCNPLRPAVSPSLSGPPAGALQEHTFVDGVAGIRVIGATGSSFCFDNETPRHRVLLHEHSIGSRLISNGEYLEFIHDGGYTNSGLWLSDGWATINERGWSRPLYWREDYASEFTLGGERDLDLDAPVSHVSYYEADAFARWADARLPTETEWEIAAAECTVEGNLLESDYWQPVTAANGCSQFFGDVWEWTSSPYSPYPGFKPLAGSLGEYNGKFMCNQMTVRGGSCVTSTNHIRASYRSFFYPDARWQFLGIRLAKDGGA
ncbi:MAG: ergothioneine biosynthesis protein EgtB, partial [Woeseiaceae bacterium]